MLAIATPNVGRWYAPGGHATGQSGLALLADRIYYRPFFVTREVRFDRLGIHNDENALAASTMRLGIYQALTNGLPGRLIQQTADMPFQTNGDQIATVAMDNESLFPGVLYYTAIILRLPGDSDLDFRGSGAGGVTYPSVCGVTAAETLDGVVTEPSLISHAATSWTAMPDPADMTTPSFEHRTPGPPHIGVRIATGFDGEGPGHAPFNFPWDAANKRWRVANVLQTGINRNTGAMTDGTVYYAPFFVSIASRIANVAMEVTTGGASSSSRIGIYSAHASTGQPNTLLGQSAEIDTATTGIKEEAITPVILAAKTNYWMAVAASGGAPTTRRISWAEGGAAVSDLGWATSTLLLTNGRPTRSSWSLAGFVAVTGFDTTATGFVYGGQFDDIALIAYELSQ